jgi:hypothetical protein
MKRFPTPGPGEPGGAETVRDYQLFVCADNFSIVGENKNIGAILDAAKEDGLERIQRKPSTCTR